MTVSMDKLWARIVLIALCAVLAAGGVFFAGCFDYGRGMASSFEQSDLARDYVEDCMWYFRRVRNYYGNITEQTMSAYSGGCLGFLLLCDGEPVLDTRTDDAAFVESEAYSRWEENVTLGNADEYQLAVATGEPMEGPNGGQVMYAYPLNETEAGGEYIILGISHEYELRCFLNYPIEPYSGLYAEYTFYSFMLALKSWALPLAVLCWALAGALAFMLAKDARRRRDEGIGVLTRVPFDALTAGMLVLALILAWALRLLEETVVRRMTTYGWFMLSVTDPVAPALVWTAAGVTLLRAGLARQWRAGRGNLLFSRLTAEARVLFPLGIGVVFVLIGFRADEAAVVLVGIALIVISGVFSVLLFRQLRRLKKASQRLAAGELDGSVETERFWPGVREQAEALDRVGDGIRTAVDEQLKGERLKTELITNVSHDLKTPITSIVSCAELLKKPETTPEQAAEYIGMLDRQCRRLKKLTDDLIEASKASAGAIDVRRGPTDVKELLNQSVGEFSERLAKVRVTPVLTLPEGPCVLDTDGQLLWRVLDNLLGNIRKYAQPDTRAYIDLETTPEATVISLKNVSATPLNITAEALMERFVRGDSSRSTEGSGLGLSIAQSLTRLLGGELTLFVDGDLFKAVIRFDDRGDEFGKN